MNSSTNTIPGPERAEKQLVIRRYETGDRAAVRKLCCDTGFLGTPIDPVFEDRELFADFLTTPYIDWEPEGSFVLLVDGAIHGYVFGGGSKPPGTFLTKAKTYLGYALRALARYRRYNKVSRSYLHWILLNSWREVPQSPKGAAHMHINLRPEARTVQGTRLLIEALFNHLAARGEKCVYGQMVTFDNRRTERMFGRYGFRALNRSEITKFRRFHPEPVYLTTVVRDLSDYTAFYDRQRLDK